MTQIDIDAEVASLLNEKADTSPDEDDDFTFGTEDPPGTSHGSGSSFDDIASDDDPLLALAAKAEMAGDLTQPWMIAYGLEHFQLVQDIEVLHKVVDECCAASHFGIDLETEGFDNRIDEVDGKPQTRHKIVGYCLAVKGIGYYIPVRHLFDDRYGEVNPNLDPALVDPEIARLCWACQPKLQPDQEPSALTFGRTTGEPHPVACFFNAKFDQEYLYPVTGLDIWHQESFQDMYLAGYVIDSENGADTGLKEYSERLLSFTSKGSKESVPLKMIKFIDLFPKEVKNKDRHFKKLYPKVSRAGKPLGVVLYGCSDALCTLLLCLPEDQLPPGVTRSQHLVQQAEAKRFAFTYPLEKRVTQSVRIMERSRGLVDQAEIEKVRAEAEVELAEIEAKIKQVAAKVGMHDFNPSSFPQVAELLYDPARLDLSPKPEKTLTGQYKTTMKVLEDLVEDLGENAPPVVQWIVIHRQISKAVGTYLTALANDTDENGCLRYNFKQTGTATGRFTAPKGKVEHGFAGIPIQGIPAREDPRRPKCATSLRRIFIARPGYVLVKVDYAGQELRVVTNISGEPVWTKEFLEGTGDLHTLTAQAFWPGLKKSDPDFKSKRQKGKGANFSLVYGGGVSAIMRATGVDKEDAAQKLAAFNGSVPVFAKWVANQHALVKKNLGVISGFGRWMALPDAAIQEDDIQERLRKAGKPPLDKFQAKKEAQGIRASCERKSTNYPIQGSGADILKISLSKLTSTLVHRGWLKTGLGGDDTVRMLMTVHDEVVFEVAKHRLQDAMPVIIECMEYASTLRANWPIKLIVEPLVGTSWDAKYDWLAIMEGKDKIPACLEGYVTPTGKQEPQEATQEQAEQPPAEATHQPVSATPAPLVQDAGAPNEQPLPSEPPTVVAEPRASQTPPPSDGLDHVANKGGAPVGMAIITLTDPLTERLVASLGEALEVGHYLLGKDMPEDDFVATLQVKTGATYLLSETDGVRVPYRRFLRLLAGANVHYTWELLKN